VKLPIGGKVRESRTIRHDPVKLRDRR